MENLNIQTSQNIEIVHNVAGVGSRILAQLLDYIFLGCYFFVMFELLSFVGIRSSFIYIFLILPALFYHLFCETVFNGQSLGKKLMKIRVVMVNGSQPGFSAYLVRWVLRLADITISFGSVAVLFIILTKKTQRLGDLAAGTTVIKLAPIVNLESLLLKVEENYQPVFYQVSNMTEADISTLREVMDFYNKNFYSTDALGLLFKARQNIEKKLNITSEMKDAEFLKTIIKDYNSLNQ